MEVEDAIKGSPLFSESRLESLYSNFSNLCTLNPEGYDANVEAWASLITYMIENGVIPNSKISILTNSPKIEDFLTLKKFGNPKGLPTVFRELVRRRIVIPSSLYLNNKLPPLQDHELSLIDKIHPRYWINQSNLSNYSPTNKDERLLAERYISVAALRQKSLECLEYIENVISQEPVKGASVFEEETLRVLLQERLDIFKEDFAAILKYIISDLKKCVTKVQDSKTYFKFDDKEYFITEEDVLIADLKSNLSRYQNRSAYLEKKVEDLDDRLRSILRNNSLLKEKDSATSYVHLRKLLKESLEKVLNAESQINIVLHKINEASLNYEVFEQLKNGTKFLRDLNSKLKIDKIEEMRDDLDEEIGKTNEMSDVLTPIKSQHDDDEIEAELQQLYDDAKEEERHKLIYQSQEDHDCESEDILLKKLSKLRVNSEQERISSLEPAQ